MTVHKPSDFVRFVVAGLVCVGIAATLACDLADHTKPGKDFQDSNLRNAVSKEECLSKQRTAYTKFAAGGSGSLSAREVADLNLDCEPGLSPSMAELFPERVAPGLAFAALSRPQVLAARKRFKAEITYVDLVHDYAPPDEVISIHRIRVRVTNGSSVVLPFLTLKVNRQADGENSWGRTTAAVEHVTPGQTAEVTFYPRGHVPRYAKVSVEIEPHISATDEQFFLELRPVGGDDPKRVSADEGGEVDRQWKENRFGAMKGDGKMTRSFRTAKGTVEVGMTWDQVRRIVDQRNVIGPRVRLAKDAHLETYQFGLTLYNVRFDDANVVRDIAYGEPDCGLNTCQPR
jgi:hypothetical protein